MAELKTFDFTGALGRGLQLGQAMRQQENQGKLAALLGQARTTSGPQRDALMEQAYGLDPATGIAADQGFGQLDEAKIKRLGQMAGLFVSMTPEQRAQAWPSIRQEASQIIPTAQYPVNWDESLLPQAQSLHQQLSGIAGAEPFTLGPGSKRFGPDGRVIAEVPFAPKEPAWQLMQDAEGNYHWGQPPSAGTMPGTPTGAMPAPTTGGGGAMLRSSFDDVIGPLLGREGGYVADDAGAGPTNYGINSRANPDVNVASLTPDAARDIYRERYWDAIDADNLPPQIREAAFDAAVNMGVGKARELLQQSGGDPAKFDQLRRQHYGGLVSGNPQKYGQFADGWERRVADTGGRSVSTGIRGPAKAGSQNEIEKRRAEIAALRQSGVEMSPAEERAYLLSGKPIDDGKPKKPLPVTALKLIKEENDAIQAADEMNFILNRARERIQSGELDLSFMGNLQAKGVNFFGNPGNDKSARNFQSFMSDLQKARNASLRLNNGVQTEGDAKRAWDELFKNITDEGFVLQRMSEIEELNKRAMTYRQGNIDMVRQNYGLDAAEDDVAEDVDSLLELYR